MKNDKVIRFYCSSSSKRIFSIQKFLRSDIIILKELGYKVLLSLHWYDYLKFWTYDLSFIYFYRFGIIPAFISKLFRKKVIFTGGIDFLNRDSTPYKTYLIQCVFFKLCNKFSDKSILVSDADVVNVSKISDGTLPPNCILSYHGIDSNLYFPKKEKEKIVLTIALMERKENVYRKGVLRAINAFAEFVKSNVGYKMYIIGKTGEGTKCVYDLINELQLSDNIIMTGPVSEEKKIDLLQKSEYYFQLSDYEGFGIAALEALSTGCKVIHSGKGGLAYVLGDLGFKVKNYNDAKEVAKVMSEAKNTNMKCELIKEHLKQFSQETRKCNIKQVLMSIMK